MLTSRLKWIPALILTAALTCDVQLASAQPQGGLGGRQQGQQGQRGGQQRRGGQAGGARQGGGQQQRPGQQGQAAGGQRISPLISALDVNGDGNITRNEVALAYESLKKLDRNGDGKLSTDEFRPAGAPAGPQQQGPRAGQGGGQRPGAGAGQRPGGAGAGRPGGAGQRRNQQRAPGGQAQGMPNVPPSEVNPRDLPDRPRDIRFRNAIEVGAALPNEIVIYDTNKQRVPLQQLFRDRYTVVVCGCLTCPAFLNAYPEVEAVYADYKDKVDFYFLYHVLAHPENRGYVQPMTIDERFMHIAEAKRTLKTSVPWIADSMDNELKRMYVFASNPEFIFAPDGKVVHREPWSRGTALRDQLEKLVGPSPRTTSVAELGLPDIDRVTEGNRTGVVERVKVNGVAVPLRFATKKSGDAWYAKMRPEVDQQLVSTGSGQMYVGFHLDPIHQVNWNNLADPLTFELNGPDGVRITPGSGEGARPKVATDHDPREFLVNIENWTVNEPLTLTVFYMACNKVENWCKPVKQEYTIYPEADSAAGRVNGRTHLPGGARGGAGGGRGPGGAGRGPGGGGPRNQLPRN